MSIRKQIKKYLLPFCILPISAFCQRTDPDLPKTVAFLNASLQKQSDSFMSAGGCDVAVSQGWTFLYATPIGPKLKSTDANGLEHYGFEWNIYKRKPGLTNFNLRDIDPLSVSSTVLPSVDFLKKNKDIDAHPERLKEADLTFVFFKSRNASQSIHHGDFPAESTAPMTKINFDKHSESEFIIFRSHDGAERFVTALKHAIVLCGGTESDFAPTPSE